MDSLLFFLYGIVFLILMAAMLGYTYFTAKMRTDEAEERQRNAARGIAENEATTATETGAETDADPAAAAAATTEADSPARTD